jgi:hypothetical protein
MEGLSGEGLCGRFSSSSFVLYLEEWLDAFLACLDG